MRGKTAVIAAGDEARLRRVGGERQRRAVMRATLSMSRPQQPHRAVAERERHGPAAAIERGRDHEGGELRADPAGVQQVVGGNGLAHGGAARLSRVAAPWQGPRRDATTEKLDPPQANQYGSPNRKRGQHGAGMTLRVHVDPDRCQGHNRCKALAPSLFVLDALGHSREAGDGTRAAGTGRAGPARGRQLPGIRDHAARRTCHERPGTPRPPARDWATDFDHLDPRWSNDPYPIWAELRQTCPIAHTERFQGCYFPSTYDGVRAVAHDTEHFSSRRIIVRDVRVEPLPAPPHHLRPARAQAVEAGGAAPTSRPTRSRRSSRARAPCARR